MSQVQGSYDYSIPYYYDLTIGPLPFASIWDQASIPAYFSDPFGFYHFHEDFDKLTIGTNTFGGWTFTSATSGSVVADTTDPNGAITISAGAVTAAQGVNFQFAQVPIKLHATVPTVFECKVKFGGLTSLKIQAFVGLCAIQTAIIASSAVGTDDKIGFAGVTTTGVLQSNTTASSTATTGTGVTIANSTSYRFGFVATTAKVSFFVNGSAAGAVSSSTTNIPTSALAPSIVCQANATVTPTMTVDYIRILAPRA